jgi:hypothetical protein
MLPLDEKLREFAEVVRTCARGGYQSKVLLFEEIPTWITA